MANFPTDSPSPNSFRCSARFRRQQDPFVRERSSGMSFRPGIRRRHKSSPSLAIKDPSACNTPRKWSLSSILIMTLVLASFCTFFINTATVLVIASSNGQNVISQNTAARVWLRPVTVTGKKRNASSESAYYHKNNPHSQQSPRVVYMETRGKQLAMARGRVIASSIPEPVIRINAALNKTVESLPVVLNDTAAEQDLSMTNLDTADRDHNTNTETDMSYLDKCIPKSSWQTTSFINCNAFHEIDMSRSFVAMEASHNEEQLAALGEGWFRTTWRLDTRNETTVLKTLRIARDFLPEYYELHRRDAVAMERLTWSPFIVDVFGYCGNSAINEIADFPHPDVKDLEHFDRRMRYRHSNIQVQRIKLQLAASVAQGVADIHSIDGPEVGATMVHYDLNPRNIAMFRHGRPKINDFNIAEFLRYDPETNQTCGFPNRMKQPWWRAPEEVNLTATVELDEKSDIYSLGAILFHILTTHSPRGKMKAELMEGIRADVLRGKVPVLPHPYDTMKDPVTLAFKKAMDRCFVVDPTKRATADEVVGILFDALVKFMEHYQKTKGDEVSAMQNHSSFAKRQESR